MKYAVDTSVSVQRTRVEIEDLIQKAGGSLFAVATRENSAQVIFELSDRRVMFELPLPPLSKFQTEKRRGAYYETKVPAEKARQRWEQACRSLWRSLYFCIKAKLVSIDSGVETFDEAFLAQVVVSQDGRAQRFGELAIKAIEQAYSGKSMPPLLGSGS